MLKPINLYAGLGTGLAQVLTLRLNKMQNDRHNKKNQIKKYRHEVHQHKD